MRTSVRTTIDLPEDLLIQAKKKAAELRRPLRALIESGLRAELRQARALRGRSRKIRWKVVDGGLPKGINVSSRESLREWLRRERS